MMSSLRPIKKRSRDLEVLDALTTMIEQSGLKVGDRLLTESELVKRLDVGRSTIREALKAWQGMVIITRNKGAGTVLATEIFSNSVFIPISLRIEAESLIRTHSVKCVLEVEASKLAASNANHEQRKLITAKLDVLLHEFDEGNDWRAADLDFHTAINNACGNPLFGQMIKQLHNVFPDIYEQPFGQVELGEMSIPFHQELAMAIVRGDVDGAGNAMQVIVDMVQAEVKEMVDGK